MAKQARKIKFLASHGMHINEMTLLMKDISFFSTVFCCCCCCLFDFLAFARGACEVCVGVFLVLKRNYAKLFLNEKFL